MKDRTAPPGYYHAQGDPVGTVRYWDGDAWIGDVLPEPPGYEPPATVVHAPFAGVGIRIGAALVDALVTLLVFLPVLWPQISDALDDASTGAASDELTLSVTPGLVAANIAWILFTWVLISRFGGSVGKLACGLRITHEDGATSPPGYNKGALRSLPALIGVVPFLGAAVSLSLVIVSVVWVANDAERRSAYDRIAGTRVVRKSRLSDDDQLHH